jgi:2-polyprenyl-6-methoxyphenol hydroxylase-like FAD-dependent oxidoreductase
MKVGILGAGPAGLYAAILLRKTWPAIEVKVFEQGAADATWGFGVVFSDRALEFLRADDPETADLIEGRMEAWSSICVIHRGERIEIDGFGFRSIGRLEMLQLLQGRATALGITPHYRSRVEDLSEFDDCDLLIAADGIHSVVRAGNPDAFGQSLSFLDNHFAWYGVSTPFASLTQTFRRTEFGDFNAHHYRYSPTHSTFLVECSPAAFAAAGFADMPEPEYRGICERIFADQLAGVGLIDNHSVWRRFPVLVNSRFFHRNHVLVGDALHTAHYSIGSGTRLAMEDVIALVRALEDNAFNVEQALPAYQAARQPILQKLTSAAMRSAGWYQDFGRHMELEPWQFALSYIMRSGRMDGDALKKLSPGFYRGLEERGIVVK